MTSLRYFFAAIYIAGFFLTFGYIFNRTECGRTPEAICSMNSSAKGVILGAVWPVYWAFTLSVRLTSPPLTPHNGE